jgi:hypothetical protein
MTKLFSSKEQFDLAEIMADTKLTEDEIQDACNAAYVAKEKAKKAVLDKLGITSDEFALLQG